MKSLTRSISCVISFNLILWMISNKAFSIPDWAKSKSQERIGSLLRILCQGEGPSLDTARKSATAQCKGAASHQLQTEVHVKTVNVESERSVAYFQEVSSDQYFSGLICTPKKEEAEETPNGLFRIWLLCEFDLSKVKEVRSKKEASENEESQGKERSLSDVNRDLASIQVHGTIPHVDRYMTSSRRTLYLETVPMCSSLLIRGERTRVIECNRNPQPVVIESSDKEIVVQEGGSIPKTINLENTRNENGESIRVLLDSK